ncbi:MAG: AMP-dependent synthetase/ligase [Candidatus Binataceae bacterium]
MARVTVTDSTLALAFDKQAKKYQSRPFLKQKGGGQWQEHSWSEVSTEAGYLRADLIATGIKKGDRVAIMAENCPEWVIADQAILGMGAVVVPVYTTSSAEEVAHVLNDSGARIVAVKGAAMIKRIAEIAPALPSLERIITLAPADSAEIAGLPVIDFHSPASQSPAPVIDGSRDDLATLIYTSGTTGPMKGAMLSHGNILADCEGALNALILDEDTVVLSFLPIAHAFERTAGYYTVMLCGGTIAYAEGLNQIAHNLAEIRPTVFLTVPRLLEVVHNRVMRTVSESPAIRRFLFRTALSIGQRAAWYRDRGRPVPPYLAAPMMLFRRLVFARIRALFGDRISYLVSGSAPLRPEIIEFFAAAEVPIFEGYGLTEAAPAVSVNLPGLARIGTVGRAVFNVEVRTADDGELLVRGPNVMRGYFGREQDTREAIDADGWLHTGDLATIDSEGYIQITDRKKEIIVLSGGKNVSPANLEDRLTNDPYIAQACVIGDRRKHLAALLSPNFENLSQVLTREGLEDKSAEELCANPKIRAFFQNRLREFNRPLSDVETIAAFTLIPAPFSQENSELTPTLKLRRRVIQAHYRGKIEAMYRD